MAFTGAENYEVKVVSLACSVRARVGCVLLGDFPNVECERTMTIWGEILGGCGGYQDLSRQSKASGDTGNRRCLGSKVEFNSRT